MKLHPLIKQVTEPKRDWFRKAAPAHLHFILSVAEGVVQTMYKRFGDSFEYCVVFVNKHQFHWFWQVSDMVRLRRTFIRRTLKNPQYPDRLIERWRKDWHKFIDVFDEVRTTDLRKLSDRALVGLYDKLYSAFTQEISLAQLTDSLLTTGSEDWFYLFLKERLPNLPMSQLQEAFKVLSAPVHNSFANVERIDLLSIACLVYRNKALYRQFRKGNIKSVRKTLYHFPGVKKQLQQHADQFFWTENNYFRVFIFDADHYIRKLIKLFAKIPDPRKQYLVEKNRITVNRQEKQKSIKKYKISRDIQSIVHLMEEFTILHDTRKSGVFRNNHCLYLFLEEIARRTKLPLQELFYITQFEISDIVLKRMFDRRLWRERMRGCVFIFSRTKYSVFSGRILRHLPYEYFLGIDRNISILRGVAASPGYVRAKVRVIRTNEDFRKMKQGEILVTNNTTPEFVPLMEKAVAIVTEQGGMTTHAAIVSRELGIPCVIGTKIATQVLKDGDKVEVDATKGIIRKL